MFLPQQDVSKRHRSPSLDRTTGERSFKKQRTNDHPDYWKPSERFWDALPRVRLTRRALAEQHHRVGRQEFQLRNKTGATSVPRRSTRLQTLLLRRASFDVLGLRRFARGGGPDLTDLRGCHDPTMSHRTSRRSEASGRTSSSKKSSPYDANYQMKLAQAGIHLTTEIDEDDNIIMPTNYDEIMERLRLPRESLSPSRFPEREFQKFLRQTEQEILESETMQESMTTIDGRTDNTRYDGRKTGIGGQFNNLEPFDPEIAMAVPDSYDGAHPLSIDHHVLNDLDYYICPSTDRSRVAVPNFFPEGKSRKGRADVARRQAAHYGAIGARGIASLQTYPSNIPQYDGNAYSFTNTYQDGQLKIYTTHATAPKMPDIHPSYFMTQLKAFSMTSDSETFRKGATHYSNARDLANEYRLSSIQQANLAATQMPTGKHSSGGRIIKTSGSGIHDSSRSSPLSDTSTDELALESSFKSSKSTAPLLSADVTSSSSACNQKKSSSTTTQHSQRNTQATSAQLLTLRTSDSDKTSFVSEAYNTTASSSIKNMTKPERHRSGVCNIMGYGAVNSRCVGARHLPRMASGRK